MTRVIHINIVSGMELCDVRKSLLSLGRVLFPEQRDDRYWSAVFQSARVHCLEVVGGRVVGVVVPLAALSFEVHEGNDILLDFTELRRPQIDCDESEPLWY